MTITKTLRSLLGVGLLCGAALAVQAQNPVTFQVDMTSQPLATDVFVRGSFNGWGTVNQLTNNGSGVYTGTVDIATTTLQECKFNYNPGDVWESVANRQFVVAGGAQTLPLTSWNVSDWPAPINQVTFQVDMTAQVLLGAFVPPGATIQVSGAFNGWGGTDFLTNNPALSGNASNIYSMIIPVAGFPTGPGPEYKFRANGGWESVNNRTWTVTGGDQILPLVYYNNDSPCDLLQQDTTVTFVLQITNGTVAMDGTVFNGGNLYVNGAFPGWAGWDALLPQPVNNPGGSDFYEYTLLIPRGRPLAQHFKFSIGGADNENGMFMDHVQYIRTLGSTYTMPVCHFGTNYNATLAEASFGNLAIGAASGGTVPITWQGRQCVTLQTRSDLTAGVWTDLPATDTTQSTNYPVGSGSQFFRLQKRSAQ